MALLTSVVLTAWARRLHAVCSAAQHQRNLWEGEVQGNFINTMFLLLSPNILLCFPSPPHYYHWVES